jgi:hypothetical protein
MGIKNKMKSSFSWLTSRFRGKSAAKDNDSAAINSAPDDVVEPEVQAETPKKESKGLMSKLASFFKPKAKPEELADKDELSEGANQAQESDQEAADNEVDSTEKAEIKMQGDKPAEQKGFAGRCLRAIGAATGIENVKFTGDKENGYRFNLGKEHGTIDLNAKKDTMNLSHCNEKSLKAAMAIAQETAGKGAEVDIKGIPEKFRETAWMAAKEAGLNPTGLDKEKTAELQGKWDAKQKEGSLQVKAPDKPKPDQAAAAGTKTADRPANDSTTPTPT